MKSDRYRQEDRERERQLLPIELSAPHSHHHDAHGHHPRPGGHDRHAGHTPEIFQRRFLICLILTLPILYFEPMFQMWFNYQAIQFAGVDGVIPIFSTMIYCYGGWVFLKGAWHELQSKIGMMTLVALAITVAFIYSLAVSLGLKEILSTGNWLPWSISCYSVTGSKWFRYKELVAL